MRDELRRMALLGSGIAELTRNRAEQIVRDLVRGGDIRREQASGAVKELMERSRQNRKEVTSFVRTEIQHQVTSLGFASKREVDRLERRVERLEGQVKTLREQGQKKASATKTTAKKTTAKKTTAKKTTAKKTTAKKTTAKSTAAKSTAAKSTASRAAEGAEPAARPATPAVGTGEPTQDTA